MGIHVYPEPIKVTSVNGQTGSVDLTAANVSSVLGNASLAADVTSLDGYFAHLSVTTWASGWTAGQMDFFKMGKAALVVFNLLSDGSSGIILSSLPTGWASAPNSSANYFRSPIMRFDGTIAQVSVATTFAVTNNYQSGTAQWYQGTVGYLLA